MKRVLISFGVPIAVAVAFVILWSIILTPIITEQKATQDRCIAQGHVWIDRGQQCLSGVKEVKP